MRMGRYEARRIQAKYQWSDAQLLLFLVDFTESYVDPSKLHDLLSDSYPPPPEVERKLVACTCWGEPWCPHSKDEEIE